MKYLCRFWLVSLSLFSSLLLAQPELANRYLSHKLADRVLQLTTQQGLVTLTFYTDQAVEALYHSDQVQLPSFAKREGLLPVGTELTLLESATNLELASSSLRVQIDKYPFRLRYFRGEERLLEEDYTGSCLALCTKISRDYTGSCLALCTKISGCSFPHPISLKYGFVFPSARQDAEQGMLFRDEYASRLEDKINPYFRTRYWLWAAFFCNKERLLLWLKKVWSTSVETRF